MAREGKARAGASPLKMQSYDHLHRSGNATKARSLRGERFHTRVSCQRILKKYLGAREQPGPQEICVVSRGKVLGEKRTFAPPGDVATRPVIHIFYEGRCNVEPRTVSHTR